MEKILKLRPEEPEFRKKLMAAVKLVEKGEQAYLRLQAAVDALDTGTDDDETHQTAKVLFCLDVIRYLLSSLEDKKLKAAVVRHVVDTL